MYDHLEEREGRDLDALEVVGVGGPRLLLLDLGLGSFVVVEYAVGGGRIWLLYGEDVVLELPCLASDGRRVIHC